MKWLNKRKPVVVQKVLAFGRITKGRRNVITMLTFYLMGMAIFVSSGQVKAQESNQGKKLGVFSFGEEAPQDHMPFKDLAGNDYWYENGVYQMHTVHSGDSIYIEGYTNPDLIKARNICRQKKTIKYIRDGKSVIVGERYAPPFADVCNRVDKEIERQNNLKAQKEKTEQEAADKRDLDFLHNLKLPPNEK